MSTLAETAVETNSTIVFPLPFEVMRVFEGMAHRLESEAVLLPPPPQNGPHGTTVVATAAARTEVAVATAIVDDRSPRD